jgi:hypothetical protein
LGKKQYLKIISERKNQVNSMIFQVKTPGKYTWYNRSGKGAIAVLVGVLPK